MKLKVGFLIFLGSMLLVRQGQAVQSPVPVASKGETLITQNSGALRVQVKIRTHEVDIGKPSDARPLVVSSSCTYSRYPCSVVDGLSITVNGSPIFVPRSAFCDLADLNKAEIDEKGNQLSLTLYGGDASESFVLKIDFDADQIKKRILYSATSLQTPLQETTYNKVVEGD